MGGALGGVFLVCTPLAHGGLQSLSPQMWCVVLLESMVGLTDYFYMNQVMSMLGAFYTRVVELWQAPMLWAIRLFTEHAHLEWARGAMSVLVARNPLEKRNVRGHCNWLGESRIYKFRVERPV